MPMATHDDDQNLVFRARGLSKVYGEGPSAVHALRGEFMVLLGASGSGQSTLLNMAIDLLTLPAHGLGDGYRVQSRH